VSSTSARTTSGIGVSCGFARDYTLAIYQIIFANVYSYTPFAGTYNWVRATTSNIDNNNNNNRPHGAKGGAHGYRPKIR